MPTTSPDVELFLVGGAVRDEIIGVHTKDFDFAVQTSSYDTMKDWLREAGFNIFEERLEYLTIRARFPKNFADTFGWALKVDRQTADFVLCRRDGTYTDGRHPDAVYAGTIHDDLARRDFTVNAMARTINGALIDPFGGEADLADRSLRCVGTAEDRMREDALRALRAIRFAVTKEFTWDAQLRAALHADWLPALLAKVAANRRREELTKAFHANTPATLDLLGQLPKDFRDAVFTGGLWLKPTMEK